MYDEIKGAVAAWLEDFFFWLLVLMVGLFALASIKLLLAVML